MKKDKKQLRIVLLGPQGSGKGTQAEILSFHLGLPTITMSVLLHEEIRHGGSRAKNLEKMIKEGRLVPNEKTIELLKERLGRSDCKKGFIIDGFPRAVKQQEALDQLSSPTHVMALEITDKLALERLGGRLISRCGKIYHETWNPPKANMVCDECGDILEHREDDKPKAIRERLAIYHSETKEVLARYKKQGILHRIDASFPIPVVHAAIIRELGVSQK